MRAPAADELAAIAAAYLALAPRQAAPAQPGRSTRWAQAARPAARDAVRGPSAWKRAGRLDD